MKKIKEVLTVAVNLYLAVSTLVISIVYLFATDEVDHSIIDFKGMENLRFFTVDSNIMMALCAIIFLILYFRRKKEYPRWFAAIYLMAVVSVGVTFITVACFLAPGVQMAGGEYFSLFQRANLYFHLINPVVGMAGFLCLLPPCRYSVKFCLLGIIPTAVYAVVYTVSIFTGIWPDFYNFTFGGHYGMAPVVIAVFLVMAFGISLVLTRIHNRVLKV